MTPPASSPRCPNAALTAAYLFGLPLTPDPPPVPAAQLPVPAPGTITLLTGPSGAGKSTLLRRLARDTPLRVFPLGSARLPDKPAVSLFSGTSPSSAMRALAAAGLADARCFLKAPTQLSDGQRWRLRLALAHHAATRDRRPALLVADEFASILDRPAAATLARLFRRTITRSPLLAAAVATAHTDIIAPLAPDHTVTLSAGAPPAVTASARPPRPLRLRFVPGTREHYQKLAPYHYLPGDPAVIDSVFTAHTTELVAVLVVSRPTLNGAHRDLAWPGRFSGPSKRRAAQRLNAELRCISRVIVDPRYQGQGIAQRLVRRYLRSPVTPCTEAVAAMGAVSPFFARAGMTAYSLPPAPHAARLADALEHIGLTPPDLADPAQPARLSPRRARFINRELRRWASAAAPRRARNSLPELWSLARTRHATHRFAFAHTHQPRAEPSTRTAGCPETP